MSINLLQETIAKEIKKHGGVRPAARALKCSAGYLSKLHNNPEKYKPRNSFLKKLGLKSEVTYVITYTPTRKNRA